MPNSNSHFTQLEQADNIQCECLAIEVEVTNKNNIKYLVVKNSYQIGYISTPCKLILRKLSDIEIRALSSFIADIYNCKISIQVYEGEINIKTHNFIYVLNFSIFSQLLQQTSGAETTKISIINGQPSMEISINNQNVCIQENQLLQFLRSKYYLPRAKHIICLDSNYQKVNQNFIIKIETPIAQISEIQYVVLFVLTVKFPVNQLQSAMVIDANDKMQRLNNYIDKTGKLVFPGQIIIIKNFCHINSYKDAHGYIVDDEIIMLYEQSSKIQQLLQRTDVISQCKKIKPDICRRKYVEFFPHVLNIYSYEYLLNDNCVIFKLIATNTANNSVHDSSTKISDYLNEQLHQLNSKEQIILNELVKSPNMVLIKFLKPISVELSKQFLRLYVIANLPFNDTEVIYEIIDHLFLQKFLAKPSYIQSYSQKEIKQSKTYMQNSNIQICKQLDVQQNLFQQGKIFGPRLQFSENYYLNNQIILQQASQQGKKSQETIYTSPERPVIQGSQQINQNSIISISSQLNQVYSITSSKNSDKSSQQFVKSQLYQSKYIDNPQKDSQNNASSEKVYIYQIESQQQHRINSNQYQNIKNIAQLRQPLFQNSFQQLKLQISFEVDGISQMGNKRFGTSNDLLLKSAKIVFPRLISIGTDAYLINIKIHKVIDSFPNLLLTRLPQNQVAVIKMNVIKQIFSQYEGKTQLLVQNLNVLCVSYPIKDKPMIFIVDIAKAINNLD